MFYSELLYGMEERIESELAVLFDRVSMYFYLHIFTSVDRIEIMTGQTIGLW
jgi:hypothetical protein